MSGFGSAPRAHAIRQHRGRHIELLLFECPHISGLGGSLVANLLRNDLFRACSGSDHARAVLLATFPSDRTPAVAATACHIPFLLDPAAALGRHPPCRINLQCLALVVAFLLGVPAATCTRLPSSVSVLAEKKRTDERSPAWLVVRPLMVNVAAPAVRFCVFSSAALCACSCFAHVRPYAQGRYGRCPPGSGVMSHLPPIFFGHVWHSPRILWHHPTDPESVDIKNSLTSPAVR